MSDVQVKYGAGRAEGGFGEHGTAERRVAPQGTECGQSRQRLGLRGVQPVFTLLFNQVLCEELLGAVEGAEASRLVVALNHVRNDSPVSEFHISTPSSDPVCQLLSPLSIRMLS